MQYIKITFTQFYSLTQDVSYKHATFVEEEVAHAHTHIYACAGDL